MKILYILRLFALIITVDLCGSANESTENISRSLFQVIKNSDYSLQKVKTLIEKGAQINAFDKRYRTPLHWAALYGHEPLVVLLLEKKVDINILDREGCSPLHCAIFNGHTRIVNLLLKAGANPIQTNNRGYNAVTLARKEGYHILADVIMNSPNWQNKTIETPIATKTLYEDSLLQQTITPKTPEKRLHPRHETEEEVQQLHQDLMTRRRLSYVLSLSPIELLVTDDVTRALTTPIEQHENFGSCSPTELYLVPANIKTEPEDSSQKDSYSCSDTY